MDQTAEPRVRGGHKYKCVLLHSHPQYVGTPGSPKQYECEMTAHALRNAIKMNHQGDHKTLEQLFDPEYASIAATAWGLISSIKSRADFIYGNMGKSLLRVESRSCSPSMLIDMDFSALICDGKLDDEKKTYAGVRPVPRSIYDIRGSPDADLWMNACYKEVNKLFEMGPLRLSTQRISQQATR